MREEDLFQIAIVSLLFGAACLIFSALAGCGSAPPRVDWRAALETLDVEGDLRCEGEARLLVLEQPIATLEGSSGAVGELDASGSADGLACAGLQVRVGGLAWQWVAATQDDERCAPLAGRVVAREE